MQMTIKMEEKLSPFQYYMFCEKGALKSNFKLNLCNKDKVP